MAACRSEEIDKYLANKFIQDIDTSTLIPLAPEKKKEIIFNILRKIVFKEKLMVSDNQISLIGKSIYEDAFEYGPISSLMKDNKVIEIMINDYNEIYFESEGIIERSKINFKNRQHVRSLAEKLINPQGQRIDESFPMADSRLKDGSRINVVIPPVTTNGSIIITIRKFKKNLLSTDDLIKTGSISREVADFLNLCVKNRLNIIVSGGTSTGKTTFLNILSNFIPINERIITIEETPELNLRPGHVLNMEGKPPNIEGVGEITLSMLIRNSLRMRPDRLIVGEIRGKEAVDVLQAMNTGHEGSMTTIHANSPLDLLSRLETMLLMSGINLNPVSAKKIMSSSIDIIIQLERNENGFRFLTKISGIFFNKINRADDIDIEIKDLIKFEHKLDKNKYVFSPDLKIFYKEIEKKGKKIVS